MKNSASVSDQKVILIVDDTPTNLDVLVEVLSPFYKVLAASSGIRALEIARNVTVPDLILLDVMMPGIDGYEVLHQLQQMPKLVDIPVIFITALSSSQDEERGFELGAVDYVSKPFNPATVLARIKVHLELKAARDQLSRMNEDLELEVARRMRENLLIQELNVRALACVAEARDNETGNHIMRTSAYVEQLALELSGHERFQSALTTPQIYIMVKAAPLHDIGKVGIPDAILLKPGSLTVEEFAVMKTHPSIGADAISRAMEQAASGNMREVADGSPGAFGFLKVARDIVLSHHERWDGSGYPVGLSGEAIPVSARLMALADVYDALRSARVYKAAMSHDKACSIIREGRATHFDPAVVDAFEARHAAFATIASKFADEV
jgi:putative two-component system response regulator